ncbi:putative HVA22-like protein g [Macadamia integrifolia]|uniref:putative HVA22-like protein g n=1 Tax=Macadamia integrifolia TaxID=60698 RepID=UPI001C533BC7|nr:putative HVA22-like protein g [Macadamia integrifolia]XP_042519603.1 putative HVA22-like protein g [Macadamia integrifolia]
MLGDFINRSLVMLFGYAFPAFECYKTVEKNRVEIDQLRFWCQYWIIVALLTVLERIGDVFVSWLPMYGETKVVFLLYLWYPKTKGTSFVYETFFRPYVARHETDIERKFQELRVRAWDLATFHWQNTADFGQTTFFQLLQYFASQSSKASSKAEGLRSQMIEQQPFNSATSPRARQPQQRKATQQSSKKWPWSPSAPPLSSMKRLETQPPKFDIVQEQLPSEISLLATMMDTDTTISASDDRTDPPAQIRTRRSQARPHQ